MVHILKVRQFAFIVSNIRDMASCLNIYLSDKIDYAADTYKKLKEANAAGNANEQMNIRMDGVGMTWMLDDKNDIVWHNGATSDFNGYVGFTKDKKKAW